jgi:hypothetical protein
MKLVIYSIIGMILSTLAISNTLSQTSAGDSSLQAFLPRFEEGISGFICLYE